MLYIKRLYALFSSASMVLFCFMPICKGIYLTSARPFSLWEIFGVYILLIPCIAALNTLFDGLLFMRFKFNFVLGELWFIMLFYIYCRLDVYGFTPLYMSAPFYMAFIPAIIISALALSIRDCDGSGMSCITKYDFVWLIFFGVLGILTIIRCIIMKNDISSLYAFDDIISKAVLG